MAFIEVSGLTKSFRPKLRLRNLFFWPRGAAVKALENITFTVPEGEIFGLIGANGAGKSTLLKIIATLVLPDRGGVRMNGYDIIKDPQKAKEFIGWVSGEERSLYWRLTGPQNLEFFAAFYNLAPQTARQRISELIKLLEINAPEEQQVGEYSTGMKQRINLARSLLHNPPCLLLDEPTKSLDPSSAHKLRRFIKEELVARRKKTIILATHNLSEAELLCDRIGIMSQGQLELCGTIDELRNLTNVPAGTGLEKIYQQATHN